MKEYGCKSWSANNTPSGFCKCGHSETMEAEHSMGRKKRYAGVSDFQTVDSPWWEWGTKTVKTVGKALSV